jgi:hypothetical protein
MPTSAITALATLTLGSAQATVTFSSITSAYRDLRLVVSGTTSSNSYSRLRINSDTGISYYVASMEADGSSTFGGGGSNSYMDFANNYLNFNASSQAIMTCDFIDYSATNKHKMVIARTSSASQSVALFGGRWASTSAVDTITITSAAGNWATATTFTLYGVSA